MVGDDLEREDDLDAGRVDHQNAANHAPRAHQLVRGWRFRCFGMITGVTRPGKSTRLVVTSRYELGPGLRPVLRSRSIPSAGGCPS